MTPAEALAVLDQMAQVAHASRADHFAAQRAVKVLSELIEQRDGDEDGD